MVDKDMQDHEDFILFKQKSIILLDNMKEKLHEMGNKIQILEDKIENSEKNFIDFRRDLIKIDMIVKNINDSLFKLDKNLDKKENDFKECNENELESINEKIDSLKNEPYDNFKRRKEILINSIITILASSIISSLIAILSNR